MTPEELFWALAEEMQDDPRVAEGTMMGHRCLRVDGDFLAMLSRPADSLVVKLPADVVAAAVAAGEGRAFAPAGKAFREWLEVPTPDETRWRELLQASKAFLTAQG